MKLLIAFACLLFSLNCIGSEVSYEYDQRGLVTKTMDPRGMGVQYTYDALQLLKTKTYSDGRVVNFTHDLDGNCTSMEDRQGITLYEYNSRGELLKTIFPDGTTLEYVRDSEGNRTKILYPDGSEVAYSYDEANRVIGVEDSSGMTSLEYDVLTGHIHKKTFPNGSSTEFHYTSNGQVNHTIHRKSNGKVIQEFVYVFDKRGNRTKIETITPEGKKEIICTYDRLNRLKRAEYSDGFFEAFTYDSSGNRLTHTTPTGTIVYKYNEKNQLIQAGEILFFYDAAGNLTRKISPNTQVEYVYDEESRLISCLTDQRHIDFEYDGNGVRIAKIVEGVRTEYLNDPATPLQQVLIKKTKEDGQVVKTERYTYAGSRLNQTIEGHTHFYLYEGPSRSVSAMISSREKVTSRYEYSAYGKSFLENTDDNPFKYCGELFDEETGLIYLKNRYYDPDLGRFISQDRALGTLGYPETLNPYTYVNNNPINFIDPLGYEAINPEEWERVILHINDLGGWFGGQGVGGHVFLEFPDRGLFQGNYPEGMQKDDYKHLTSTTTSFECLCKKKDVDAALRLMEGIKWTGSKNCVYTAVEGMKVMGFAYADKIKLGKTCPLPSELRSQMLEFTGHNPNIVTYPRQRVIIQCQPPQDSPLGAVINLDYGGVSLSKPAEFDTPLTDIIGATVDPNTGQLILFGSSDLNLPPFDLDDLAVAVKSVYGLSQKPPEDPGVSIGTEVSPVLGQMTVRYDGATAGTAFGHVMFEADRLLKCLTLGQDNITGESFHANVLGYMSLHDRLAEENFSGELINRMWFVPEKVSLALSEDGKSLLFSDVKIQLLTESQFTGNGSDPEACIAFAEHFNTHFEEFAEEFPILEQLKTLGKVTAIVKWLKEEKIPFDTKLFAAHEPAFFLTPEMTPATERITEEGAPVRLRLHKKTKYLKHMHSRPIKSLKTIGGIVYHLGEHNFSSHEHPMAKEFAYSALEARPEEHSFMWNFSCPYARKELTALSEALYHTKKPGNVRKRFVDMQLPMPGEIPLTLTRFYNSFYEGISGFGFGWRLVPYELELPTHKIEIEVAGNLFAVYPAFLLRSPEGEELYTLFALDQDSSFLFCNRSQSTLIRETSLGSFLLEDQNTRISFNELGQILELKDLQGLGMSYRYENGHLSAISHGEESVFLDYKEDRIVSARGPHGLTIYYQYNEENMLCSSTTAGDQISYAYEESNRLSHILDAAGNALFEAVYDPYHRATYVNEAGNAYTTDFSLAQRTMRMKNAFGQDTLLRFDEDNRLIFKQEPSGRTWEFLYEHAALSQPTKIIENHAFVTQCHYDAASRLVYLKNPQGGVWRFFYDGAGNLFAESSPSGNSTLHFYDAQHRRAQSFLKVDLAFDKGDPTSPLKGFNIESGHALTYTYDPLTGSLASFTNTRGGMTTFTYDKNGQLQEIISPAGQTQLTEWDFLGNLKSTQVCGVMQAYVSYDQDLPKTISTHLGMVELQYDDSHNLTQIVESDGIGTEYRYDAHHNLIEVIDAEGGVTHFTYNAQNQLTHLHLPNGSIKHLEYDLLGRLHKKTWLCPNTQAIQDCCLMKNMRSS